MAKQPEAKKGGSPSSKNINMLTVFITVACIAFGAVVLSLYFKPAFENKTVLFQPDISQVKGMLHETVEHHDKKKEEALWTSRMFGGMPTYQIHTNYDNNWLSHIHNVIQLGLPHPVAWFFVLFIGMFVLLMAMRLDPWVAVIGAIAYSFSTYFMVAMEAGHNSKIMALGYAPAVLGGIIMTFRGRWFLGGIIFTLALGLELYANHFQITFYLLFIIIALLISEVARIVKPMHALPLLGLLFVPVIWLIDPCNDLKYLWMGVAMISLLAPLAIQFIAERSKGGWNSPGFRPTRNFLIASLILGAGGLLAVAPNLGRLYTTVEYKADTMRGGVILEEENHCKDGQSRMNTADDVDPSECGNSGGLKKPYAYNWSYGVAETFTLINPFYMGEASSVRLGEDTDTYQTLAQLYGPQGAAQMSQRWPMYYGDQPGTSGPVYVGAIIFFLFVLGMLTVSNRYRWWLLGATVISILLSWGKNWQFFSDLFFDHFPLYNNFRAVSMILVVAEITMPILAALAIHKFLKTKKENVKTAEVFLFIATGISVFVFLVLMVAKPGISNFVAAGDAGLLSQLGLDENIALKNQLQAAMIDDRASSFQFGMLRGMGLIILTAGLMFGYLRFLRPSFEKVNPLLGQAILSGGILLVVMLDLIPVNRHYINNENFVSERQFKETYDLTLDRNPEKARPYIEMRGDAEPGFRVLNTTRSTWNEAYTSYHFRSIGGYHAAKFRRYQDLIDCYLDREKNELLSRLSTRGTTPDAAFGPAKAMNMLNLKYVIARGQTPQGQEAHLKIENPMRYGPAWVVQNYVTKETNIDELDGIGTVDPRTTAVVHKEFNDQLSGFTPNFDPTATIVVTGYLPNHITYQFNAPNGKEQMVVFSEVYYNKGWNMYLDGAKEPTPHFRANYVLRAARIPGGQHTIEFKFEPQSYKTGESIGLIGSILLFLAIAGVGFLGFRNKLKQDTDPEI